MRHVDDIARANQLRLVGEQKQQPAVTGVVTLLAAVVAAVVLMLRFYTA